MEQYLDLCFYLGEGYSDIMPIFTSTQSPLRLIGSEDKGNLCQFSCEGLEKSIHFVPFNSIWEEGIHAEIKSMLSFSPKSTLYYNRQITSPDVTAEKRAFTGIQDFLVKQNIPFYIIWTICSGNKVQDMGEEKIAYGINPKTGDEISNPDTFLALPTGC